MSKNNRQFGGKKYSDRHRRLYSCSSHGGCPYCEGNRLHKFNRTATPQDEYQDVFKLVIRPHTVTTKNKRKT